MSYKLDGRDEGLGGKEESLLLALSGSLGLNSHVGRGPVQRSLVVIKTPRTKKKEEERRKKKEEKKDASLRKKRKKVKPPKERDLHCQIRRLCHDVGHLVVWQAVGHLLLLLLLWESLVERGGRRTHRAEVGDSDRDRDRGRGGGGGGPLVEEGLE